MKSRETRIISKMVEYCDDIDKLLEMFNWDYNTYTTDIAFQYSCNMCIIQIGELVSRVSDDTISCNPQIPWAAIKGMRNLHAHDYENVDLEVVWNTLIEDIPKLKEQLKDLAL